jgi:hypothetical protein
VSTDTVRKSPAGLPETATIVRLLAEIMGRQPPVAEAAPEPAPPPQPAEAAPPPPAAEREPVPPAVAAIPPEVSGLPARDFFGRVNWRNASAEAPAPPPAEDVRAAIASLPVRQFFRRVNWRNVPGWVPPEEAAFAERVPDTRTLAEVMAELDWD